MKINLHCIAKALDKFNNFSDSRKQPRPGRTPPGRDAVTQCGSGAREFGSDVTPLGTGAVFPWAQRGPLRWSVGSTAAQYIPWGVPMGTWVGPMGAGGVPMGTGGVPMGTGGEPMGTFPAG